MKIPFRQIVWECLVLIGLSVATALIVNFFSPSGIALFGKWDTGEGVITARPRNDVVVSEREISNIQQVKLMFDRSAALFVDARPEAVFREGHIKGAVSFPAYQLDEQIEIFLERYDDPSRLIIVYCSGRECTDSHTLAQFLSDMGYMNIKVFIDGYTGWKNERFPIESGGSVQP